MKTKTVVLAGAIVAAAAILTATTAAHAIKEEPEALIRPAVACVSITENTITFSPGITGAAQDIDFSGSDIVLSCYSPSDGAPDYELGTLSLSKTGTNGLKCDGKNSFSGHATIDWDHRPDNTEMDFTGSAESINLSVPNHSQGVAITGQGGGLAPRTGELQFVPTSSTGDCTDGITEAAGHFTLTFTLA